MIQVNILAQICVWVFLMSLLGVFGNTIDKHIMHLKERVDALTFIAWKLEERKS